MRTLILMVLSSNYLIIISLVGIATYVLGAVALSKLAKNENIDNAWLAWIPICNYYITGLLIKENFTIFKSKFDSPEILLPFCSIVALIGTQGPSIAILVSIAGIIPIIASVYHMLMKYKGSNVLTWTIICTLLPIVYSLILFSIRNNTPTDTDYIEKNNNTNY